MVRIKMLFKMGKWWGLCICATIAGRVGEETFQGNCRINGSQTQLPVRSITRAHRIIIVIIIIIINSIITIMIMNITIISDTIATTINNARTAAQLFTIDKSQQCRRNNILTAVATMWIYWRLLMWAKGTAPDILISFPDQTQLYDMYPFSSWYFWSKLAPKNSFAVIKPILVDHSKDFL